eukprot:3798815-Pyramimonas_sp.AAC.1
MRHRLEGARPARTRGADILCSVPPSTSGVARPRPPRCACCKMPQCELRPGGGDANVARRGCLGPTGRGAPQRGGGKRGEGGYLA